MKLYQKNAFPILFVLSTLIILFTNMTATNSTNPLLDSKVFDWRAYLEFNPELVTGALIDTKLEAEQHWLEYGYKEGRRGSVGFWSMTYLEKDSEVRNAYGAQNWAAAVHHYLDYGFAEGRFAMPMDETELGGGNALVGNGIITLRTSHRYAGAVTELWLRGKQIENEADVGRLIQMAMNYDNAAECDNPTEAGAQIDKQGPSSSQMLGPVRVKNQTLQNSVRPAYWVFNGQVSSWCQSGGKNPQALADVIMSKTVSLNYLGNPNLINWKVLVKIEREHAAMRAGLAGYFSDDLNKFYHFNPESSELEPTDLHEEIETDPKNMIDHGYPLVYSTPDGKYAVAAVGMDMDESPEVLAGRYGVSRDSIANEAFSKFPAYLGVKAFKSYESKTTNWGIAYYFNHRIRPGYYPFEFILAVGTLSEVHAALRAVYSSRPTEIRALLASSDRRRAFTEEQYLKYNPDLATGTWKPSALQHHLLISGLEEKRRSSYEFHSPTYLNEYSDVALVYGPYNYTAALKHFLMNGIKEGRVVRAPY